MTTTPEAVKPKAPEAPSLADEILRPATVFGAITEVMRLMRPIPKGSENTQGSKFWYRGIDAILAELHPIMARVGLVIYPEEILSTEFEQVTYGKGGTPAQACRVRVRFRMVGPDGSSAHGEMVGGSFDSGDKAVSKAITMATKSYLNNLFQIPSGDPDPDGDSFDNVQPIGRGQATDDNYDARQEQQDAGPSWKDYRDRAIIHGVEGIARLIKYAASNGANRLFIETLENDLAAAQLVEKNAYAASQAGQQGGPAGTGDPDTRAEATKSVVPQQDQPDPPEMKRAAAQFTTRLNACLSPAGGGSVDVAVLDRLMQQAWQKAEETQSECWTVVAERATKERDKLPFPAGQS